MSYTNAFSAFIV